jgi:hypothetical protein
MLTLFVSLLTRAPSLLTCALLTCAHDVCIYTDIYFIIRCGAAAAGIFNAWNRAQNTIYNLAQRSPHREQQQQHDREQQQQKDQEWRRFLLSDNDDYDREDIIISIDDDVSAMMSSSPSTSSSTLVEGTRSNNNDDHNQENPTTPVMKKENQQEEKRNKVVSFRLSERDYERHLSMAKLCHENGLTKGPDIVSYIRLSMECLWQYINSQAEKDRFTETEQQRKKEEGELKKQDQHQAMITPTRGEAIEPVEEIREERRSDLSDLEQYFHPVFEELNKLNKTLDSLIEEENNKGTEKKK